GRILNGHVKAETEDQQGDARLQHKRYQDCQVHDQFSAHLASPKRARSLYISSQVNSTGLVAKANTVNFDSQTASRLINSMRLPLISRRGLNRDERGLLPPVVPRRVEREKLSASRLSPVLSLLTVPACSQRQ